MDEQIGAITARSPIGRSVRYEPEIGWRLCVAEIKRSTDRTSYRR